MANHSEQSIHITVLVTHDAAPTLTASTLPTLLLHWLARCRHRGLHPWCLCPVRRQKRRRQTLACSCVPRQEGISHTHATRMVQPPKHVLMTLACTPYATGNASQLVMSQSAGPYLHLNRYAVAGNRAGWGAGGGVGMTWLCWSSAICCGCRITFLILKLSSEQQVGK